MTYQPHQSEDVTMKPVAGMTPVALPELPPSRYAKTGDVKDHNTFDLIDVRAYALAERAAERERCAAICDEIHDRMTLPAAHGASSCAAAIRSQP